MIAYPHNSFDRRPARIQAGFSLIEILVGLAIGLLATLVIMQVFSVFEGQKRTTTGSSDAQTNGSIAIYSIEHELKMAGYGLLPTAANSPLSCTTLQPGSTGLTSLWPVIITDSSNTGGVAGPGASDSISIHYGTTSSGGVPTLISGGASVTGSPNKFTLNSNQGCKANDVALVVIGTTCYLSNVTSVTSDTTVTPQTDFITLQDVINATPNSDNLSCLGGWVSSIFRINPNYDPSGGTATANSQAYLEKTTDKDIAAGNPGEPIVSDIVNIQAQYGVSATAGSNQVTQWLDAKDGQASGNWGPGLTVADRNRIKAVHIAVVARDGLYEKNVVTNTCTTTKGTVNKGPCAWDDSNTDPAPKIDLSNDPNWRHYRYRVFQTIVPLRNMIWARSTL